MDYFYQPEILKGKHQLSKEDSRHCCLVLRKKEGDIIQIINGNGGSFLCKLIVADPKKTIFEILEEKNLIKPEFSINIAISPTKSMDRMEWFIEKTAEIGIDDIYFIRCSHSERKVIKTERMIKKAVSAIKQSGNSFLPKIHQLINFEDYLRLPTIKDEKYICHQVLGKGSFLSTIAPDKKKYHILIGPEGDFSKEELDLAKESMFKPVSLGNSRLRTETAGVVACTLLNAVNIQK